MLSSTLKLKMEISYRNASLEDLEIYYKWANEPSVRIQSFNSEKINFEDHVIWFKQKLVDENCMMLIFSINQCNVGQVRFQVDDEKYSIINISISEEHRGKGYGLKILNLATKIYFSKHPNKLIKAYVKIENISSNTIFEKAKFILVGETHFNSIKSYVYVKHQDRGL